MQHSMDLREVSSVHSTNNHLIKNNGETIGGNEQPMDCITKQDELELATQFQRSGPTVQFGLKLCGGAAIRRVEGTVADYVIIPQVIRARGARGRFGLQTSRNAGAPQQWHEHGAGDSDES